MVLNYPTVNNTVKLFALTDEVNSDANIELLGFKGEIKVSAISPNC
jgi:hypothetical protein